MSQDEPTNPSEPATPGSQPSADRAHVGPRFDPPVAPAGREPEPEPERPKPLAPLGGFVAPNQAVPSNRPPPTPIPAPTPPLDPARYQRRTFPKWPLVILVVVAAAGIVYAASLLGRGPTTEDRYLEELRDITLDEEFDSDAAAVANAERVCAELEAGGRPIGYEQDLVGVKYYCDKYLQLFQVEQTPEDKQTILITRLEAEELRDQYPSDGDAVDRALALCESFKGGEPQKGGEADQIGVEVYCPEHLPDFSFFETTVVLGTFVLKAPSGQADQVINTFANFCEGRGLFEGYHEGTKVIVRNGAGDVLADTFLGKGSGSSAECVFTFSMELTEGEGTYEFTVDDTERREFTFEDIKDGNVDIQIGG